MSVSLECPHTATPLSLLSPTDDKGKPVILSLLSAALRADIQATETSQNEVITSLGDTSEGCRSLFHATTVPRIQVEEYIERLFKYTKCSPACLIMAFAYIRRLADSDAAMQLSILNVHRLLIAGTVIASKFTDDKYFTNKYYAQVGGVSLSELNCLELELLKRLNFKAHVPVTEIAGCLQYVQLAAAEGAIWVTAQRQGCGSSSPVHGIALDYQQPEHLHESLPGAVVDASRDSESKLTMHQQGLHVVVEDATGGQGPCTPILSPRQGSAIQSAAQWMCSHAAAGLGGCKQGHGHIEQVVIEAA